MLFCADNQCMLQMSNIQVLKSFPLPGQELRINKKPVASIGLQVLQGGFLADIRNVLDHVAGKHIEV